MVLRCPGKDVGCPLEQAEGVFELAPFQFQDPGQAQRLRAIGMDLERGIEGLQGLIWHFQSQVAATQQMVGVVVPGCRSEGLTYGVDGFF